MLNLQQSPSESTPKFTSRKIQRKLRSFEAFFLQGIGLDMASTCDKEQQQQFHESGVPSSLDEVPSAQESKDNLKESITETAPTVSATSLLSKRVAATNSCQQMISTSPAIAIPHLLENLLRNITTQRDHVLKLIDDIDPTYLVRSDPRWMEEHKLRAEMSELQAKILAVGEEVHLMKIKNAQLEHLLNSFHKKEDWRAAS